MSGTTNVLAMEPSFGLRSMSPSIREVVLAAFTNLMRPLVRILLKNGIAYGEFAEVVKRLYVEVTASSMKPISEAKIAIKTGLNRADVSRLLNATPLDTEELEAQTNRVGRILTLWHQETGPYGIPLELPFEGKPGQRSFCELVRRAGATEIPPNEILDELVRVGAAVRLDGGRVRALARSYLPSQTDPAALEFMGVAFTDLASTLARNLEYEGRSKFFERRVWTPHGLPVKDLPAFEAMVHEQGQEFLERLDDWISPREAGARISDDEVVRVGVATYMFQREQE
jgi:hypothetical protein